VNRCSHVLTFLRGTTCDILVGATGLVVPKHIDFLLFRQVSVKKKKKKKTLCQVFKLLDFLTETKYDLRISNYITCLYFLHVI